MSLSISALMGLLFLGLAIASTYLMFHFWGYEYDKEARKSSAPQWKMNIHRGVGYAYAIVYVIMMAQMVPRLWQYQVEFPPRTVAHICFGITIGVILLVKISILRWFRHFEEWMPALGVALLLCTFLLTGLSLPFFFKEHRLATSGPGGSPLSEENRARVERLLAGAEMPDGTDFARLAAKESLRAGREVLLTKCVFCHDLKTSISRPRMPDDWYRTVRRMAEKPTLGSPISELEMEQVTAYLVAITPELQRSAKAKRVAEVEQTEAQEALLEATGEADGGAPAAVDAGVAGEGESPGTDAGGAGAIPPPDAPPEPADSKPAPPDAPPEPAAPKPAPKPAVDWAAAKSAFDGECSQCHPVGDVDAAPPRSRKEVDEVLRRMVENGFDTDRKTIRLIRAHMIKTYVE